MSLFVSSLQWGDSIKKGKKYGEAVFLDTHYFNSTLCSCCIAGMPEVRGQFSLPRFQGQGCTHPAMRNNPTPMHDGFEMCNPGMADPAFPWLKEHILMTCVGNQGIWSYSWSGLGLRRGIWERPAVAPQDSTPSGNLRTWMGVSATQDHLPACIRVLQRKRTNRMCLCVCVCVCVYTHTHTYMTKRDTEKEIYFILRNWLTQLWG